MKALNVKQIVAIATGRELAKTVDTETLAAALMNRITADDRITNEEAAGVCGAARGAVRRAHGGEPEELREVGAATAGHPRG